MRKLVFLGLMILAGVVFSSTYLYPNGVIPAGNTWTAVGCTEGATEYQCVDEATLNTSDYLYAYGMANKTEMLTLTNLPAGVTTIDYVRIGYSAKRWNSTHYTFYPLVYNLPQSAIDTNADWNWYWTDRMYTNPATGNPWTASEVDNLVVGMAVFSIPGPGNSGARIALVRVLVSY